jgi:hypothetical protein
MRSNLGYSKANDFCMNPMPGMHDELMKMATYNSQ